MHLGEITLRRGRLEIEWRLTPGHDPTTVCDVVLHTSAGPEPVEVEVCAKVAGRPHGGVFRVALPPTDPPWTLQGDRPVGPWQREIDPDHEVLADYRAASPVDAVAEAGGLRVSLDRACTRPERLTVFYAIDWMSAGRMLMHAHIGSLRATGGEFHPIAPPAAPGGTLPMRRPLQKGVACFPPQPAGQPVSFVLGSVTLHRFEDVTLRVPVPQVGPSVVEPNLVISTGHHLVEASFGRHGVTLRFVAPQGQGFLTFATATDERGRPLVREGASGGGERTVMQFGPMPPEARELVLEQVQIRDDVRGPWKLDFTVPEPLSG